MISQRYREKAKMYKVFAEGDYDFSEEALSEMYDYESRGVGTLGKDIFEGNKNGYFIGKKYMDITIASWLEEIEAPGWLARMTMIYKYEFPEHWLDGIFKGFIEKKDREYKDLGIDTISIKQEFENMKKRIRHEKENSQETACC